MIFSRGRWGGQFLLALLVLSIGACDQDQVGKRPLAAAVQEIYRAAPPPRLPGQSKLYFPLGLYHGLSGAHYGRDYDLAGVRQAGFNLVHPWEGQDLDRFIADAKQHRLKVLPHWPSDEQVRRYRKDPSIIAWYLDEEPTHLYKPARALDKLDEFWQRRRAIRKIDPGRPVMAIDDRPSGDDARRKAWQKWAQAGDISAHFNYPLTDQADQPQTLSLENGIAQSVKQAVRFTREEKPVWLVVQAFASPRHHRRMPSPQELRAMVFSGIIHGATGLIYFGFDSFVMRDGQVLGMAPAPQPSYGPTPDFDNQGDQPLAAKPEELASMQTLWQTASSLNRDLIRLAPVIFSATARLEPKVFVTGRSISPTPIRVLLKKRGHLNSLFLVNLDDVPLTAAIDLPTPPKYLSEFFGHRPVATAGGWQEDLEPLAVRVYQWRDDGLKP